MRPEGKVFSFGVTKRKHASCSYIFLFIYFVLLILVHWYTVYEVPGTFGTW